MGQQMAENLEWGAEEEEKVLQEQQAAVSTSKGCEQAHAESRVERS